ncbi:hypothetical protein Q5752_006847 [Cryptotrichosporon argae]
MPSLNNVVSSLVRAAASVPADISDADLDAHVARLLADEARAKESQWGELGLGAFLRREQRDSPDPSVPKPNKRFLASVIRNVDGHNASLLRAQAESAQGARNEFEDARRGDSNSPPPPPRSPPPPARGRRRSPPSRVASKMDRYFSETYDPRLDFEDAVVPASGPVMDVGWDNMLAVLKERGSKRRHQSPGLSASPEPVRKTKDERREAREAKEALRAARTSQMRRARNGESDDERERRRARKRDKERKRLDELGRAPAGDDDKDKEQDGAMDRDRDLVDVIGWKYTKKGGTREWDVGKET